jgi:hypothetical protein
MKTKKKWLRLLLTLCILIGALAAIYFWAPRLVPEEEFRFAYRIPESETETRQKLVDTATRWAGVREEDGSHRFIIDLYNTIDPLPQDYVVTYEDAWCAAFVSAAALEAGMTDIIPSECSCNRQIGLFQELGRWEEDDGYLPLPGDIIYYDWDFPRNLDCIGWSEHVGIVVGTYGPFIRVMEGNKDDDASFRTVWRNDWCIRGYGLPDYASKCQ